MKFAPLALIERIQARILPRQACESLNPIHPPEIGPLLRHLGAITFSGAHVFQRRGNRVPAIEMTRHIHLPGFRIEKRENNFLFLQRGKPR